MFTFELKFKKWQWEVSGINPNNCVLRHSGNSSIITHKDVPKNSALDVIWIA